MEMGTAFPKRMATCSHSDARRVHLRAVIFAGLQLAVAAPLCAQDSPQPATKTQTEAQGPEDRGIFVMGDRPSLRFGTVLRLDLTSNIDLELRDSPEVAVDTVEMGRRRIGVDGRLFDLFGFQIEGDVADREQPWRDVFVEFRKWRALRIKAGRFKMPFGQERLTSIRELEFARRSVATETLTPGRDTGVELNGRLFDRALEYNAGVFRRDGDVSRDVAGAEHGTVAARVAGTPLSWLPVRPLRRMQLGFNATSGHLPQGLNGLRARTYTEYEAFAPIYVSGRRVRLGADASFAQGPLSVRAEFLQTRDDRERQGLSDEDLPALVAQGWHISATSFVVGSLKSNGTAPRAPLGGGGIGAIQVTGRIEALEYRSDAPFEVALRNPRAANIQPNDFRAATVGVNWYPVRFVKVQFNVIREHLQDPERRPNVDRPWVTTGVLRFQFAL